MTKQESAQRIYRWAFNVTGNKKSGCISQRLARRQRRGEGRPVKASSNAAVDLMD